MLFATSPTRISQILGLLIGYLILKSTFLPRFLGVLMLFCGFGLPHFSVAGMGHLSFSIYFLTRHYR